jgi:toxin FitB
VRTVVFDTDVASLSIKDQLSPALQARVADAVVCVSFVTVGEMRRWVQLHGWGQRRREGLAAWLHNVVVLPYDENVATIWGDLSAAATRRGRPRPQTGSLRAAWPRACRWRRGT